MLPPHQHIPSSGFPVPAEYKTSQTSRPNHAISRLRLPAPIWILSPARENYNFNPCKKNAPVSNSLECKLKKITVSSPYYNSPPSPPPTSPSIASRPKARRSHSPKAVVRPAILRLHRPIQHRTQLLVRLDVARLPAISTLPRRPLWRGIG
jgi:hypothetical protein